MNYLPKGLCLLSSSIITQTINGWDRWSWAVIVNTSIKKMSVCGWYKIFSDTKCVRFQFLMVKIPISFQNSIYLKECYYKLMKFMEFKLYLHKLRRFIFSKTPLLHYISVLKKFPQIIESAGHFRSSSSANYLKCLVKLSLSMTIEASSDIQEMFRRNVNKNWTNPEFRELETEVHY